LDIQAYLNHITTVFVEEMKGNLVGIYLHGSLAMGCFNPERSDIDLLVICSREVLDETKRKIIGKLMKVTKGQRNPLEMSIVQQRYLKDFVHPTPFELHYFHPAYLTDENYICGGEGFEDPDLAGHITVTYHRGIKLVGPEIKELFRPIDKRYYIESILNDIEDSPTGMGENPVYFTLNLCRVLYYLAEGKIASKKEGGEWGKRLVPSEYQMIVEQCLDVYQGTSNDIYIHNDELIRFAEWMLGECRRVRDLEGGLSR
jgi:predicted nucleotidyltransferase